MTTEGKEIFFVGRDDKKIIHVTKVVFDFKSLGEIEVERMKVDIGE